MKSFFNLLTLLCFATAISFAVSQNANAQLLLNEVEIDPPSTTSNACQFTEIRGTAGATVPANTYFLSVNSDGANFGFANQVAAFGGQVVGSNGTITLYNTAGGVCANRTFPSQTTLINYFSALVTGTGSETYLVVRSTTPLSSGADLDVNDDGVFDANFGITVLDGFALIVNPEEEYVYGAQAGVVNISNTISLDQPDAVTRFPGNSTPFVSAAFYYGELAATPDETNEYAAPFSTNFPNGGRLTPGGANVPTAIAPIKSRSDFDGDGKTDISVFRPSSNNWFLLNSTSGFSATAWGATGDEVVPQDYDGDGKTDIAVKRGATWFILLSSNNTLAAVTWGLATDTAVTADYDGDGKADAAVYRAASNTWFILRSSNGAVDFVTFGASGDVPVTGDFDGDGKADQTVFRNGQWITRKSSDNSVSFTSFGLATDKLVPADYDGDNKDDIAVWRPSNGVWYILRSTNGAVDFIQFGANGDVAVPGDYDGDGKDDQAVYRGGTWFLNRSTAGFSAATFGLAGDIPTPSEYIP